MSDYLCPYRCSYRTNAGYCGYTGGHEACQYRRINGFDYESKQFYAEPVKTPEERYVWPPKTKGDLIRAMTDEELADKFEEIQLKTVKAYGNDDLLLKGELREYWLDWLKQEVTDNSTT